MAAVINFFKRFRHGRPVREYCDAKHFNRVSNVLEDISGIGCRVQKPLNAEGLGWRIIVDGTSDHELPPDFGQATKGFPYGATWPYGLLINGDTVSVYNATVERYPSRYEATPNPTDIVMDTKGTRWVGYLFDSKVNTLTVTGPHTSEPETSTEDYDDGLFRGPLFKFTVEDDGEETPSVTSVILTRDYVHGRMDLQIYG
jgi:hypothetical protein